MKSRWNWGSITCIMCRTWVGSHEAISSLIAISLSAWVQPFIINAKDQSEPFISPRVFKWSDRRVIHFSSRCTYHECLEPSMHLRWGIFLRRNHGTCHFNFLSLNLHIFLHLVWTVQLVAVGSTTKSKLVSTHISGYTAFQIGNLLTLP